MSLNMLNPPVFHILLALSRAPLHGLGIADRVEEATGGGVELGPGTLYRSLKEMVGDGLIEEAGAPAGSDPRRKYYAITAAGRRAVADEAARLERLVELARAESLLPERA